MKSPLSLSISQRNHPPAVQKIEVLSLQASCEALGLSLQEALPHLEGMASRISLGFRGFMWIFVNFKMDL